MTRAVVIFAFLVRSLTEAVYCSDTNLLIIPKGDNRAGGIFFVDECLTRGLTNSISVNDLRNWATNTIERYRRWETALAKSSASKRYPSVAAADVPNSIGTIQTRIPSCRSAEAMPKIKGEEDAVEAYSRTWAVSKGEAEARLRTTGPDQKPPKVGFWRSSEDTIQAVTITWYLYGVIVGPESFKPEWEHDPWYHRKLADGIYLRHGYK